MIQFYFEVIAIFAGAAVLFLLSLLEGALVDASPVALRMNLEHEGKNAPQLLALVVENKSHLFLPLHLGIQITILVIAVLTTCASLERSQTWGGYSAFGVTVAITLLLRQLLPRLMTQNEPEKKLILLLRYLNPIIALLRVMSAPLVSAQDIFKRFYQETGSSADQPGDEAAGQEIQAYLEIGENEGILEKEDTKLIQSVVEFGDTLVREVMTPRTKIAACDQEATMGELRDIMVGSHHSRIPIYRGDVDHIIGVAYIRQLLAQYSKEKESESITGLIHPALFVPETKRVSALLKELQVRGDHTAIVIDEFGGVAGLVTIEDLVEEIVGEIRDEDQAKVSEIVEEGPHSFVLRGSTEIHYLEDLSGKRFARGEAATVAGLVASHLGRIPAPGEEFDMDGLRVQIVDADRKRIRRLRILLPN